MTKKTAHASKSAGAKASSKKAGVTDRAATGKPAKAPAPKPAPAKAAKAATPKVAPTKAPAAKPTATKPVATAKQAPAKAPAKGSGKGASEAPFKEGSVKEPAIKDASTKEGPTKDEGKASGAKASTAKPGTSKDAASKASSSAKGSAKPDAKPDAKSDGKPDGKADTRADAKADGKVELKPDAKADGKPDPKADAAGSGRKGITIVSPKPMKKAKPGASLTAMPAGLGGLMDSKMQRKPLIPSGPKAAAGRPLGYQGEVEDAPPAVTAKTPFGKKDLERFRSILQRKRQELLGDVRAMESEALRSESGSLSNTPSHMAEQGSETYDQALSLDLAAADRRIIKEIDDALARIEAGTFGICELTGKPIKLERLEELPWARYSIEAARELERKITRPMA